MNGQHGSSSHAERSMDLQATSIAPSLLQINPDAATAPTAKKRGRPRKVVSSLTITPATFQLVTPVSSPDAITSPLARKRGRPKKSNGATTSTSNSNRVIFRTSSTNFRAVPARTPGAPASLRRCRLDILWERQHRQPDAVQTGPRRARVLHLPPLGARTKHLIQRKRNSFPALEGHNWAPKYDSENGDTISSHRESAALDHPHPHPVMRQNAQVPEPSVLPIALKRVITYRAREPGFHLLRVAASPPGDLTEDLRIPDRSDSKEALSFCGLTDEFSDTLFEEWKSHGKPGTLGSRALDAIQKVATERGFNPWAFREIEVLDNLKRLRDEGLHSVRRNFVPEEAMPDAPERRRWESSWTSSLSDVGFAQPVIDMVNQGRFDEMRARLPVSHWAYNFLERRWESLLEYHKQIENVLSRHKRDAEKNKDKEDRTRDSEHERQHQQKPSPAQQSARQIPPLSGTPKIEGQSITVAVRPRSPNSVTGPRPSSRSDAGREVDTQNHNRSVSTQVKHASTDSMKHTSNNNQAAAPLAQEVTASPRSGKTSLTSLSRLSTSPSIRPLQKETIPPIRNTLSINRMGGLGLLEVPGLVDDEDDDGGGGGCLL